MQVVQHWIIGESTTLLSLAMASRRPRPGSWASAMLRNAELVLELISELISELLSEFTDDQMEMIKETVVAAVAGTIMVMIAELTRDWVRD